VILHPLIVVTGSRVCERRPVTTVLEDTVDEVLPYKRPIIVHGNNKHGADAHADVWGYRAIPRNLVARVERFDAYWDFFGNQAGAIRNAAMAERAWAHQEAGGLVIVLAFPLGESTGTRGMITEARRVGINDIRTYEQEIARAD